MASTSSSLSSSQDNSNTTMEINGRTLDVPSNFICPITLQIMMHPVMTISGQSFERAAIMNWLETDPAGSCPLTRKPMRPSDFVSNRNLELKIRGWRATNGIEINEDDEDEEYYRQPLDGMGFLTVPDDVMDEIVDRHLLQQVNSLSKASTNARPERKNVLRRLNFLRRT